MCTFEYHVVDSSESVRGFFFQQNLLFIRETMQLYRTDLGECHLQRLEGQLDGRSKECQERK